jgi:hypothetical protein
MTFLVVPDNVQKFAYSSLAKLREAVCKLLARHCIAFFRLTVNMTRRAVPAQGKRFSEKLTSASLFDTLTVPDLQGLGVVGI